MSVVTYALVGVLAIVLLACSRLPSGWSRLAWIGASCSVQIPDLNNLIPSHPETLASTSPANRIVSPNGRSYLFPLIDLLYLPSHPPDPACRASSRRPSPMSNDKTQSFIPSSHRRTCLPPILDHLLAPSRSIHPPGQSCLPSTMYNMASAPPEPPRVFDTDPAVSHRPNFQNSRP